MNQINPKIRALWVAIVGVFLVVAFLSRIEQGHGTATARADDHQVTVERIPSSEAKKLGVDLRNH